MYRILLLLCLLLCSGCSRDADSMNKSSEIDGGTVKNPDRDKAAEYLSAFENLQSAEDEKKLLSEFGEWLENKGYRIRVEVKHGKHNLACPYFPPVTPWTEHLFFDIRNLDLLPLLVEEK